MKKIKKYLIKNKIIVIIILILIIVSFFIFNKDKKEDNTQEQEKVFQKVSTMIINSQNKDNNIISTIGSVKPESRIDIITLAKGIIKNINFKIGDQVSKNKVLAQVYGSNTLTSQENSKTSFLNMQNNLESVKMSSQEILNKAKLGVEQAEESVESAKISLKTTQDNLANGMDLQNKSILDTKDSAIISFAGYLNEINSALDKVNYIMQVEEDYLQLDGISDSILGVKNLQVVDLAKGNYVRAKEVYNELMQINIDRENITTSIEKVILGLDKTKTTIDNTVEVLKNTITNNDFSESDLNAQNVVFTGIRTSVVSFQSDAKNTLNVLDNIDLVNKQEIDILENYYESAKNQLKLAEIAASNALVSLESAKKTSEQQVIGAKTSLDNVRGQLNLSNNQVADLIIKAPIQGEITAQYVELGTEVNPGQKIAEISQINNLKIEINLPAEDVYQIKKLQEVELDIDNKVLKGIINTINSVADPITKKIKIEILFDNKDKELIPGTFVKVYIPIEKESRIKKDAILIPLRALVITQSEKYVFIIDKEKNTSKKVLVELGETKGIKIEIISGLKEEDELIIDGAKNLEEGEEIEVLINS